MSTRDTYVQVNISLNTWYPSVQPFDVGALIIDTEEVPIDQRFRIITAETVEDLPEDSVERNYASVYFAAESHLGNHPDNLVLIRQAKTAIPPRFLCGDFETDYTVWKRVTSGGFTVTDGTNSDVLTDITFAAITALSQVPTVLTAALAGITTPNIAGLDDAEFYFDALGRLALSMPDGQDDTDPSVYITHNASAGTIPYLMGLTTATDGEIVAGNAVETYVTAYNEAKALTGFYLVDVEDRAFTSAGDIDAAYDLAAQILIDKRQCTFISTDPDLYDTAETGDLQSQLSAANNECALVIYYQHTDQYPDAAADGLILTEDPGAAAYGGRILNGLTRGSGSTGPYYQLTETQRIGLIAKGVNYVEYVDRIFVHRGITASGAERRLVMAKHWLSTMIQADWWAYKLTQPAVLFDEVSLGHMKGVIEKYLKILGPRKDGGRGVIDEGYTVTMPTLDQWLQADKTAGLMKFENVFRATATYEGHIFVISGTIGG